MGTFRQFLNQQNVSFHLREEDTGAPPPTDPQNTTNKYHFDSLERELNIKDITPALEGSPVTLFKVPNYNWGFNVNPPIEATVSKQDDDTYKVTFLLSDRYATNPKQFIMPYSQGEDPTYYQSQVEDKTEVMTKEELADAMVKPIEGGGMGGAPPMGGGMPPMGGGMPGGDMMGGGAPPMGGGMPPMGGM